MAAHPVTSSGRGVGWRTGIVLVCGAVASSIALTQHMVRANRYTTQGGSSAWWRAGEVTAAAALALAAIVAVGAGRRILAAAAVSCALAWPVAEWEGWASGPAWLRNAAAAFAPAPLLAATLLVAQWAGRRSKRWSAALIGASLVAFAVRLFVVDPYDDAMCWRSCRHNPFVLIQHWEEVHELRGIAYGALVVLALSIVARCIPTIARSSGRVATIGAVALVVGLASALLISARWRDLGRRTLLNAPFGAAAVGAVVTVAVICTERVRELRLRHALTRMIGELRASRLPGALATAVADALGDPGARVAYWAPTRAEFVDEYGKVVALVADAGRAVTNVVRHGKPVAAIQHSRTVGADRVQQVIGPATRLALENEQLRAAATAELAELRASRTRIVERGDAERRRLERDLHDGAQQRLVAMSLLVRMARTRAAADSDIAAMTLLTQADALLSTTLRELRQLASGIHPASLTDLGLRSALHDLAEASTDVAVTVDDVSERRFSPTIEAAAFLVASEALVDARRRMATTVSMTSPPDADGTDGPLRLDITDDASAAAEHGVMDVADRVWALDGRLVISPSAAGTLVRLEIPCGS